MTNKPNYWDTAPINFLDNDMANPARKSAADIVAKEITEGIGTKALIEVGFGSAIDYRDHFRSLALRKQLNYVGIDACKQFVNNAKKLYRESKWIYGDFSALKRQSCDIVYTKATLEHQADFKEPLLQLLNAAKRLCIVNWYCAPCEGPTTRRFNETEQVHYNVYNQGEVLDAINGSGLNYSLDIQVVDLNTLYIFRRNG